MIMQFEQYSVQADRTAIYPNRGNNLMYPILGLVGEVGETCENVKKVIRDRNGDFDEETLKLIQKELGDVLWYVANIAKELNISLEQVAIDNIDKLQSRKDRGKLSGSGDNR